MQTTRKTAAVEGASYSLGPGVAAAAVAVAELGEGGQSLSQPASVAASGQKCEFGWG